MRVSGPILPSTCLSVLGGDFKPPRWLLKLPLQRMKVSSLFMERADLKWPTQLLKCEADQGRCAYGTNSTAVEKPNGAVEA